MAEVISEQDIQQWLSERVLAYGKVEEGSFTIDTQLTDLGLDSVYALTLCGDIEDHYGIDVEPTIVWDYETIRELAGGLVDEVNVSS